MFPLSCLLLHRVVFWFVAELQEDETFRFEAGALVDFPSHSGCSPANSAHKGKHQPAEGHYRCTIGFGLFSIFSVPRPKSHGALALR